MALYDFENSIYQVEEEVEKDWELPEELSRLMRQEEKYIQPHQEITELINLSTEKVRREVKIGATLEDSVKWRLIEILHEYADIFAWSYEDMPGLDTYILVHKLPLREECPPVKQKLWRTHLEMSKKIKEEVQK